VLEQRPVAPADYRATRRGILAREQWVQRLLLAWLMLTVGLQAAGGDSGASVSVMPVADRTSWHQPIVVSQDQIVEP
jgi:hypothetical protein